MRRLKAFIFDSLDRHPRVRRQVAAELERIERECRFTLAAHTEFQTLLGQLGLDSALPIQVPTNGEPSWSRYVHPLRQHRSRAQLPTEADVVIIGAGLTGASAAYHLRDTAAQGRRVIVLERGSPACEASGRNAGHFELLPENSVGTYKGFARERLNFLGRCYPAIPREVLRVEAERQALLVLSFAVHNRDRLRQIIERENLDCDFSPKGWLYLANSEREEQAICDEVGLATRQDQHVEVWSRMKIRQEFGFESGFIGRFVPDDGSYHPAKFVFGVLQVAVNAGVELYTGVGVRRVGDSDDGRHVLETSEGRLLARSVIVATNAFTRQLLPELSAIRPAQSQISVTEFVSDLCRGRIVTSEEGPVYFNQPRAGARGGMAPLLLGGGKDRPMSNPSSRRRSPGLHSQLLRLRERYFPELRRRPFSSEWIGPIARTPDQLPAIGLLKAGVIVAAGFNGYGGSYCVAAGEAAAEIALSGIAPHWLPEDVFSPQRLLDGKPLFFGETLSLWCYAASLCTRLRAANRQLLEALEYSSPRLARASSRTSSVAIQTSTESRVDAPDGSTLVVPPLQTLKPFRAFSPEECAEVLAIARVRSALAGEKLIAQSSAGDACFVLVKGAMDVSFSARSGEKRVLRLGPSSIFGQLPLLDGGSGNGTCTVSANALLLEMKHADCQRLLACDTPVAYKFLAALTDGVIHALRATERQLERMNSRKRAQRRAATTTHAH